MRSFMHSFFHRNQILQQKTHKQRALKQRTLYAAPALILTFALLLSLMPATIPDTPFTATPLTAHAEEIPSLEIPGYEGGIKDPRIYREMVFITGEPLLLEGDITISDRAGRVTYNYRNLTNREGTVTLTRNVTLERVVTENGSDQKTETYQLTRFRETITANGVTYQSDERSNQWSQSTVFHAKPAATYFAGNWDGRKYYTLNGNQGRVIVETRGSRVGYDQHWSTIDTQTLIHYIDYERTNGNDTVRWQGTAQVQVSHNRTITPHYEINIPTQISFRGAYRLTEAEENVLKYAHDLPRLDDNGQLLAGRNLGTGSFTLDTSPTNQMLHIPEMRDVGGHYAEEAIRFLGSLNAFPATATTFGPDLPVSRGEFARALTVVLGYVNEATVPERRPSFQRVDRQETLFTDVSLDHPYYTYIETAYTKGLMAGVDIEHFIPYGTEPLPRSANIHFRPDTTITRAEAMTILIKALGFEHLAPLQQYGTGYIDDAAIPLWARNAAYLSRELGLVQDVAGYFQPHRELTKADTAILLNDFIDYLRTRLRYDYRERVLNY